MKVRDMLEIINNYIPTDEGFVNPDTGELITNEQMLAVEEEIKSVMDKIGMGILEREKRKESKKELAKHYNEEAKLEEKRSEKSKFLLGLLAKGVTTHCDHVSIRFPGKQERLALRCKDSDVPDEWKKPSISYIPDTARIREALDKIENAKEGENVDTSVLKFAYIDRRKKASVK